MLKILHLSVMTIYGIIIISFDGKVNQNNTKKLFLYTNDKTLSPLSIDEVIPDTKLKRNLSSRLIFLINILTFL